MKTFLTILCLFVASIAATDYCAKCSGNHIGCKVQPGSWGTACTGKNPRHLARDAAYKSIFLKKHNEIRNKVALGQLSNANGVTLPSATQMPTVQWDDELSQLACLNVQQCEMRHDSCRDTDAFPYAGQNLAWSGAGSSSAGGNVSLPDTYESHNDMWIDEYKLLTGTAVVDQCCGDYSKTGHFTVMIHEKSHKIGCCTAQYQEYSGKWYWTYTLTACNYAFTNMIGQRLYEKGATASKCTTGKNPTYPGLCN